MKIINRDLKGNVIKDLTKITLSTELSIEIIELLMVGKEKEEAAK